MLTSCLCHLHAEADDSFVNRGDGHHVGCDVPRQSDSTREAESKAILGVNPLVRLTDKACECEPWVAAALTSRTPEEARELALELKQEIAKGMPAWRGWGIEYREAL